MSADDDRVLRTPAQVAANGGRCYANASSSEASSSKVYSSSYLAAVRRILRRQRMPIVRKRSRIVLLRVSRCQTRLPKGALITDRFIAVERVPSVHDVRVLQAMQSWTSTVYTIVAV